MSKLQLKIKDHDNNFIVLNNIRNLRGCPETSKFKHIPSLT